MTPSAAPVRRYKDFAAGTSALARARGALRDAAVTALSVGRRPDATKGWIRFPFYHHVFDDEQGGFARQLDYMSSLGDFIGLDAAVQLLASGDPIDGRYFCVTFDDGFKNWFTNAVPILVDQGAAAAFFLVTRYIGTSPEADRDALLGFYEEGDLLMEFLNWDDCRQMVAAGMTIGSHTVNHVRLAALDEAAAEAELRQSKQTIEAELGQPCDHFCCPFGRENIDYFPDRDPNIARRVGFKSFLSGHRGAMRQGNSPMMVRRDHLLAGWGNAQLRYFFSS
jgi:peptidoglycan/xylan/chitin deacetylase (PgdA/CDA1 family)